MKLLVIILLLSGSLNAQSFWVAKFDKGRTTQLNKKTVAQKKQLNFIQKHSLLYKIRREASYKKKRKQFK